jgi:hypothetical protein
MAFIPTPNTARVDVLTDLDGQHCENTLWFHKRTGSPVVADLVTLGGLVNAYWNTAMLVAQSIDCSFRGCVVTDQSSETAPAINAPFGPASGGVDTPSQPNSIALCVKFLTAGRGRSSRGRNYFFAIPVTDVTANTFNSVYAAQVVAAYAAILSDPLTIDWEWVVVSHFLNNTPRAAGLVQPILDVAITDLTVDNQRRRLPGRGN